MISSKLLVITQAALLHYSRVFETSSNDRSWSRLTFGCHNPTGFYKQASRIGTVPSSSCQGSGRVFSISGYPCGSSRRSWTGGSGKRRTGRSTPRWASCSCSRAGRSSAAAEVSSRGCWISETHTKRRFKFLCGAFIFVIESNKVNMSQWLTWTENYLLLAQITTVTYSSQDIISPRATNVSVNKRLSKVCVFGYQGDKGAREQPDAWCVKKTNIR